MEKRRWVKTDEITVNMLIHALRDVFRKEKAQGAPATDTGNFILRLAGHREKKLYLDEEEYRLAVRALNVLRDTYIQNGRYTDGIDAIMLRIVKARYKTYRIR